MTCIFSDGPVQNSPILAINFILTKHNSSRLNNGMQEGYAALLIFGTKVKGMKMEGLLSIDLVYLFQITPKSFF